MKKIIFLLSLALLLASCYRDDINDLNDKYNKLSKEQQALLEEQQKQATLLANYQTLLNALNTKLTVTGFSETGEGYMVTFSDGSKMTVKHGKDGANGNNGTNGVDGKDGASAPVINSITQVGNQLVFLFSNGSTIRISIFPKDFSKGTFILNEGNMSNETGKLTYIDPQGLVYDSVYFKVNGTHLGNTSQDMYIYKGKMYLISQNGGYDGKLVIANAKTLVKEQGFNSELSSLSWPTHVVATAYDKVYIRSNGGIHRFNPQTSTLTAISGSTGAAKNRMVVVGDKVFAYSGKNVLVIQDGSNSVVSTVVMPATISSIIPSSDGNVWVSCQGSPSYIIKLKASDYSIIKQNPITELNISNSLYASPVISAKQDTLYACTSMKIFRHVFATGETTQMVNVKEWVTDANMMYNTLGVHPVTGNIYFNTIKGYGLDYLINNISVFNFKNMTTPLKENYKNYNSFPAGVYFPESYN